MEGLKAEAVERGPLQNVHAGELRPTSRENKSAKGGLGGDASRKNFPQ